MPTPIRIDPTIPRKYKFVEWMINDICNYDCIFCGDENKIGRRGRLDLATNKKIVDAIAATCNGHPFWIQVTGGEPTLYPNLIELLSYMKEKGATVWLMSNGSRTIKWWKTLKEANVLDVLYITYHSQQNADYRHIADVMNLFHDEPVSTITAATYIQETVDTMIEGCDYIHENTGAWINVHAMDIPDSPGMQNVIDEEKYEKIKKYTFLPSKKKITKKKLQLPAGLEISALVNVSYNDGTNESHTANELVKNGKSKFFDWDCSIGLDTMRIEIDTIYRGSCRVDGKKFSIDNIKFWEKTVRCPNSDCWCPQDITTLKMNTQNT